MDSVIDNDLFVEENNILPYIFTKDERTYLMNEIMDCEEAEDNDLNALDTLDKILILIHEAELYMAEEENVKRNSIYLGFYRKYNNITYDSVLYGPAENEDQSDAKCYWKKYLESTKEIDFCKSKIHLNNEEMSHLLSIMEKAFFHDEKIDSDDDAFFRATLSEGRLQCFYACITTSMYFLLIQDIREELDVNKIIAISHSACLIINKNKELYDKWLEAIGTNGIKNQMKVFSQLSFEDNNENIILCVFLIYYLQQSYQSGGGFQIMCLVDNYCDTLVRKLMFEKFVKKHRFGKVFCEEYKRYCKVHMIEPRININSILGMPLELERDTPSNEKNRYYKISENSYFNHNGDLNVEHESLSKLYNALIANGCSPVACNKGLFIYRFSGIYQKGTQIDREFRLENKMEWKWSRKQILPIIIRLLFQEGKGGKPPFSAIASFFKNEDPKSFSSKCKHVGENSLNGRCEMLKQCGFTGFDDIRQQILDEKKTSAKKQ